MLRRLLKSLVPRVPSVAIGALLFAALLVPSPLIRESLQSATAVAEGISTGRILVHYKTSTASQATVAIERRLGARWVRTVPDLGVRVLQVPAEARNRVLAELKALPEVAFVEADGMLQAQDVVPNDPSFPQNFALGGGAWGWTMTHTTQAWDITKGDNSVVIAILDTGIKTNGLSDFDGQISSTWNVLNGSTDATSSAGNHGTYVAGIAALAVNNNAGGAGFCPGCRLMIVQVGTDSGAYLSDIASGLTWAADHGARVANMSWAGTTDSSTLQMATTYAHSKGMVMTAAAGNSNCDCVTYPAADPYVLGVAGVTSSGTKAGDSNYGSWVKVAAPEGDMTAWPSINGAPGYAPVGGTSSAAPAVAGIAGLLFSANPAITNAQAEQALESTSAPVAFNVQYGRVDAMAAMSFLGFVDPQPPTPPLNAYPPLLLVETNGDWNYRPLTSAPEPGQVLLRGQGGWTGAAPLRLVAVQWQRCDPAGAACSLMATAAKYTVQPADAGYTLYFSVTVTNGLGSTSLASQLSVPVGTSTVSPPPSPSPSPSPVVSPSPSPSPAPSPSPSPSPGPSPSPVPVPTQTLTLSGSLNPGNPVRSFTIAVGSGLAQARLSFSKCSTLTLGLATSSGAPVASASGPSVVALDWTLASGSYTYRVSGGRCSFTLTLTSPAP